MVDLFFFGYLRTGSFRCTVLTMAWLSNITPSSSLWLLESTRKLWQFIFHKYPVQTMLVHSSAILSPIGKPSGGIFLHTSFQYCLTSSL